jgi:hypothetical protein
MFPETAENRLNRLLGRAAVVAVWFVPFLLSGWILPRSQDPVGSRQKSHKIVLAQFIQRISTEERRPARREAQTFRQTTRAHDSSFRQAARTDVQRNRRTTWDYETRFRNEQRGTVRHKIDQTRAQEQVVRNHRAGFNLAQTRQRQSLRGATAQQRREQTLRISSEIRRRNIERQKANRQRIEEVRDTIRAELSEIRERTSRTQER